jgi:hypothetical protein
MMVEILFILEGLMFLLETNGGFGSIDQLTRPSTILV